MLAGVDEAGCGTLVGELVAAAVCLPTDFDVTGIKDSKKLSKKKRDALCDRIRKHSYVGVGIVTLDEINAQPFGEMRRLVFERAVRKLLSTARPSEIIIDGSGFFDGIDGIPFQCIVKADAQYPCVSAASIVAKTVRDTLIEELCDHDSDNAAKYKWRKNQGYPTREHLDAIRQYGVTSFHRTSFGPCRRAQDAANGH